MTALAAFFERRAAPSRVFRCGCCGDILHREDHMGEAFTDAHTAAVIIEYGTEVCFGCADAFQNEADCPDCGREVCTCDDAYEQDAADRLNGWAAE